MAAAAPSTLGAAAAAIMPVDDEKPSGPSPVNSDKPVPSITDTTTTTTTPLNPSDPTGVRIVQLHEWRPAARSLAQAFEHDCSSLYFLHTPDTTTWPPARKETLHLQMMEYIVYAHLLKGLVLTSGPNYACVALWTPPGKDTDDIWTVLRSGLWRLHYQLSPEGRRRFFGEFLPLLAKTKEEVLEQEEAWYLVYIGTRAEGRGKGYARKVIEYVTRRADEVGQKCYLESSHAVNRVIYGKVGFERRRVVVLRRGVEDVELDIMVREPEVAGEGVEGKVGV